MSLARLQVPPKVRAGEVVVREGESGDRYFVIETGRCEVERTVGGAHIKLAQLKPGDGFGEEALVSGAKRNATVTMLTDGALLELAKTDFDELLKQPLLQPVQQPLHLQLLPLLRSSRPVPP